MATIVSETRTDGPQRRGKLPSLENGDRLDQPTFHERYASMPANHRAELVGGIVHMPSPLKLPHGRMHAQVVGWLSHYEQATPETELYDNATVILGTHGETQPDAFLIIAAKKRRSTRVSADGYLVGGPEFLAEIASSTESIDLHEKKDDYERAGVKEYLVVALRQARVFWFGLSRGRFKELAPRPDGIIQSKVFPGLWLDPAALLRLDSRRLLEILRKGLASPEHAAFVAKLRAKK